MSNTPRQIDNRRLTDTSAADFGWATADLKDASLEVQRRVVSVSGSLDVSRLSEDEFSIRAKTDSGESVSARAKLFSSVAAFTEFVKRRFQKPAVAAGITGAVIAGAASRSEAALMPDSIWDGTTLQDGAYQAMGTQMAGRYLLGFGTNFSVDGVTVTNYASATRLNDQYVLVAAHEITSFLQFNPTGYEVLTGNNFKTNQGTAIQIASVLVYPGADGSGNVPDVAILKLAEPLAGYSDNVLGSSSPGDVVDEAGFGESGTPASGYLPSANGPARGWNGIVSNQPPMALRANIIKVLSSPTTFLRLI